MAMSNRNGYLGSKVIICIKVIKNEYGISLDRNEQFTFFVAENEDLESYWGDASESKLFDTVEEAKRYFEKNKDTLINVSVIRMCDLTTLELRQVEYRRIESLTL